MSTKFLSKIFNGSSVWIGFGALILGAGVMYSFSFASTSSDDKKNSAIDTKITGMQVYKSPTCGCCGVWVEHLEEAGISSVSHHPEDMNVFKSEQGIEQKFRSCHTAVSKDGYVFEGHIPAKFIRKFLTEKPKNAKGLAVPAMPVGSPGMEYGERFMAYVVYQLNKDGSSEVYAEVKSLEEQY